MDDQDQRLAILNPQRQTIPGPQLLHELIPSLGEGIIAIDFLRQDEERISLTYRAFHQASFALTKRLIQSLPISSNKQQIIPIVIPQCPELYVAIRAVLQAGAAFCPIQPDVPAQRLRFIAADISANVILCLEEQVSDISTVLPGVQPIAVLLEFLAVSPPTHPASSFESTPCKINPENLAYIMYTSGSTGLPKGVKVSHYSVTQSLLAHQKHIPQFKRFLQFASPTFDVSVFEIFFPFFRGCTLVSCSRERMLADLPGTIMQLNADAAELTPTVASTLLRKRASAPCLKLLLTIGEMLTRTIIEEFGESEHRKGMLYAMYGPTEAAIHCTVAPCLSASASVHSIGRPLSTVTAFILKELTDSESIEIAKVGEPGELALAGQLAHGYMNRPDQDAESFVQLAEFGRIYRTGDRAICHSNGCIEIFGRINGGQVKLHGQRVELGEIEEVALKTKGISMAVALVLDDTLVLFCESSSGTSVDNIRATCKAWLPAFMRPTEVMVYKEGLPKLPSGKVDRKNLEKGSRARAQTVSESLENGFESDTEQQLAAAFEQELRTPISRNSDLWACGLDSLRAIRVLTRVRHEFPRLSVASMLQSQDIAELSAHLEGLKITASSDFTPTAEQKINWGSIEASVRERLPNHQKSPVKVLPCSPIQIAMLTETSINGKLNFNTIELKVSYETLWSQLWHALCAVAEKNEIMRSGFVPTDDVTRPFVQVVWDRLQPYDLSLLHPVQLLWSNQDPSLHFTLRIHHAVYDGWSWELILDDLNDLLAGSSIPERPPFQDLAKAQHQTSRFQADGDLEYWTEILQEHVVTPFPNITGRTGVDHSRQAVSRRLIMSSGHLSKIATSLCVARQALLQAAWVVLLSAYTDSTDVLTGVVTSGRHLNVEGLDRLIGPCLSTLPFRVRLSSLRTAKDLVLSMQRQWLGCMDHSQSTLHKIVKALSQGQHERLFDCIFVWQEGELRTLRQRRYVETIDCQDALDYTMVLEAAPLGLDLQAKLTVDTATIPLSHAKLFLEQLDVLLSILADNLDTDIGSLWQGASPSVMSIANPDFLKIDKPVSLTDTISTVAKSDPRRPALTFVLDFDPDTGKKVCQTISYGDLYQDARCVSTTLSIIHSIKPDNLVAIIGEKSTTLYTAILGTVMAGAGYICIDPSTPSNRVQLILHEAHCTLLITDAPIDHNILPPTTKMASIDSLMSMSQQVSDAISIRSPDGLAYSIFTSGTTGTPKGVLISHQNLISNITTLSEIYPSRKGDCLLQACSQAFDVSIFEIFWTWHMGMTLCSASNDVLFRDMESFINTLGCTHLSLTPSVAALVDPRKVPAVKMLVTAGEPMNSKVFQSWAGRGLYQGYGPSETTNICNVKTNVTLSDSMRNVGSAFPNTSLFICSVKPEESSRHRQQASSLSLQDFKIVPRGAVGEIWIGGEQVGRGYTDPALTSQSFLEHPKYGRLYRSGDIGRLLIEDSLEVLGRLDDQVKVRGLRIELGEINSVLLRDSKIKDVATMVDEQSGNQRLISFFIATSSRPQDPSQDLVTSLFQQLEASLPPYMIPDVVVPVKIIPLTQQGKIDRHSLINLLEGFSSKDLERFSRGQQAVFDIDSLDDVEENIAQALCEATKTPKEAVRRNSSFYALGLDSISAIRFSQLLAKHGFPRIDVAAVLRHPSIKLLLPLLKTSSHIGAASSSSLENGTGPEEPFNRGWISDIKARFKDQGLLIRHIWPCTDLQLSMLSASEHAGSTAYKNILRFAVKGNVSQLKQAWLRVLQRQSLLSAIFVRTQLPEMPYAHVICGEPRRHWQESIKESTLESVPPQIDEVVQIEPIRLRFIRGKDQELLVIEVHHALYDAQGMTALLHEVEILYLGGPAPPPVSFGRYLEHMTEINSERTREFWSRQLHGFKPCRLAERLNASQKSTHSPVARVERLCEVPLDALRDAAAHQGVTMQTLLQAALCRLLFSPTENQDVCFGTVYSGRNLPVEGVARIIGPCFNTLPVRAQMKPNISNQQLAALLQRVNLDILPLQPSSLRTIQRLNSPDGGPLFDVLLLLQHVEKSLHPQIWELREESGDMPFPFILEVRQDRTQNSITTTLHSQIADGEISEHLLKSFDHFLHHCVLYPQALAADMSHSKAWLPLNCIMLQDSHKRADAAPKSSSALSSHQWSRVETQVREIFLSLSPLEGPEVSRHTSIFRLGLDSINAAQIAGKLRKLGYSMSSVDIMESPTLSEIARKCLSIPAKHEQPESELDLTAFDSLGRGLLSSKSLDPASVESVRPCTPIQSAILSQYIKSAGSLYYNTISLCLDKDVDLSKLRKCWCIVMQRHEMLRTGFAEGIDDANPFMMLTYSPNAVELPWRTLSGERQFLSKSSSTRFEIEKLLKPPWDLQLCENGASTIIQLSVLHALYDAQSLDMILAAVADVYLDSDVRRAIPLTQTISSILSQSNHQGAQEFWTKASNQMHSTKFPDLNISRQKTKSMLTFTIPATMSMSTLQSQLAILNYSLQTVCQAVWAKLLSAYTGQHQVTFGLVLSGRNFDDERDEAAFPCINTLPCSVNTENPDSELFSQISSFNSGMHRYQQSPLSLIKRWQAFDGEAFDSVLVLQKFRSRLPEQAPWTVLDDIASTEYAVSLEILADEKSDKLGLQLTYSSHILPPEAAELLLRQFDGTLEDLIGIYSGQKASQSGLSMLAAKETRLPSKHRLLHEMVEATVNRTPHAPALEFVQAFEDGKPNVQTWTYSALDKAANRIAHLILQKGSKVGDLIAVCFDKCPQASFAILGVLKAGCGYVAIDPSAPRERQSFIMEDSQSRVLLTRQDMISNLPSIENVAVLSVDNSTLLSGVPITRPLLSKPVDGQSTCYCLYTSGTTGTPKGCLISHENAVQAMLSFEKIFHGHWSHMSRWLQFASFHFDVSVLEQYWSWYTGIRLVSAPRDLIFEDLPGFLRTMHITHLDLTPSLARLITPDTVPSLREGVFIVGGEQVTEDIIETWGDAGCLYNFYGPSEVTIGCTVRPKVSESTKPTNIGQQWDNVGTFVLEPGTIRPVIRGAVGELCLSGALVGKGYLNQPELTAKSFVTLVEHKTRVYRTGDLVRLLHDDSFEFLGRIDDQVKLRGQRLEIGEINKVIQDCSESVKGVATLVTKHLTQGKEHLISFWSISASTNRSGTCSVVENAGSENLTSKIRRHLTERLPGYMVPSVLLAVDFIPLTANNKVNRKQLEALYRNQTELSDSNRSDQDARALWPAEFSTMVRVLAEYFHLQHDSVKPSSSLFMLGLDSISAIGLARKLRAAGFKNIDISTLLKKSVARDLLDAICAPALDSDMVAENAVKASRETIMRCAQKHQESVSAALSVHSNAIESIAPCTPLQEGMLSKVSNSELKETPYFAQFHFDIKGHVNIARLREAWLFVERTTSILRTYFVPTSDGSAQVVLKDFAHLSGVGNEDEHWTSDLFSEWVKSTKGFGKQLPWRLLISPTWGKTYMTLFVFHGIYDGISLQLLLDRVARIYQSAGEVAEFSNFYEILPLGPLCLRDDAGAFWTSKLRHSRKLPLPKPTRDTARSDETARKPVAKALQEDGISSLCAELSVTAPALFQAAWLLTLCRCYDLVPVLGLVVSGRSLQNEHAETAIGPMFNTIPLALDKMPPNADIRMLAQACHLFNVDSLPFQHTPLRSISKCLGKDSRETLIDNLFVFQNEQSQAVQQGLWSPLSFDAVPDYPINLEIEQKLDDSFVLTLVTKKNYVDYSDTVSLLDDMANIIRRVVNGEIVKLPDAFIKSASRVEFDHNPGLDHSNRCLDGSEAWVESGDPLHSLVREQISDLCGHDRSKIRLNEPSLFELGLDSIDVMKLATRLRNHGYRVLVSKIMQFPTAAGIATSCRPISSSRTESIEEVEAVSKIAHRQQHYGHILSSQGVDLQNVQRILPVTSMQEGLLMEAERYFNVMAFGIDSQVDLARLQAAWETVIEMQPILRTSFVTVEDPDDDDAFLQVVRAARSTLAKVSLKPVMFNDLKEAVEGLRTSVKTLTGNCTVVNTELALVDGKHYMILGMPHAAYDAWSLHLLHQEVARAYEAGRTTETEHSSIIPYEDHLNVVSLEATANESLSFWRHQLRNLKPSMIRGNVHSSTTEPGNPPQLHSQLVTARSTLSLRSALFVCREQGITLQSLALATWSLALAHLLGSLDVCFGVVLSGRTTENAEKLVFPTFNTVLCRNEIGTQDTGAMVLKKTNKTAVGMSGHQHFPLRKALALAKGGENSAREVFNTLFTYQKTPAHDGMVRTLYSEVDTGVGSPSPPYAVNVEMEGRAGALYWTIATQAGVMSANDVEYLLVKVDCVLKWLIENTSSPILENEDGKSKICGLPTIQLHQNPPPPPLTAEANKKSAPLISPDNETWTDIETSIGEVLADVSKTNITEIRKDTSLFALGLDSISAIKLTGLLKKRGLKVPVSVIVETQSVRRMAAFVEEGAAARPRQVDASEGLSIKAPVSDHTAILEQQGIRVEDVENVLPATAGQVYMLDLWTKSDGRLGCPTFYLVLDHVSPAQLYMAMRLLVQKIPVLRRTFVKHEGGVLQVAFKDSAKPTTLPWNYTVAEDGKNLLLTLKLHHALYDAVSLRLMISELEGLCSDEPSTEASVDPTAFILATSPSNSAFKVEQKRWWTTYLSPSSNPAVLSAGLQRGTYDVPRIETFNAHLLPMQRLQQTLQQKGVSIQALFFAICGRIYSRLASNSGKGKSRECVNVVIGIYLANRSLDVLDLPELVAPTFNVVPLKVNVSSEVGLVEAALEVQRDLALVGKQECCGAGLREVWEWTGRRVDFVLNFLKVVGEEEEEEEEGRVEGKGRMRHAEGMQLESMKQDSRDLKAASPYVEGNGIQQGDMDWCLPSIDVEAKVEDGWLGMGVFAPKNMLGGEGVRMLMESCAETLRMTAEQGDME